MSYVLRLSHVGIHRLNRSLFSELNCNIKQGRITVVLGANGVGKSSLLLAIAGLLPFQGEMFWQGKLFLDFSRKQRSHIVAWQGDLPPTEFGLTVRQRLNLVTSNQKDDLVQQVTHQVNIQVLLDRMLAQLSSGERQRVELAALMLRDVPIWLLDEPTAHLDLKHQVHCVQMLRQAAMQGQAIVVVLHDLQQAMSIADDVILIHRCGTVQCGVAGDLCNPHVLSQLFGTALRQEGEMVIPNYVSTDRWSNDS